MHPGPARSGVLLFPTIDVPSGNQHTATLTIPSNRGAMSRTSIPLLALALLTACADGSTAPVPAPEGACGGIAQVKSWDVSFHTDFTASDTVDGRTVVLGQHASTGTLRADSLDLAFAPSEVAWRGGGNAGTVSVGDTARTDGLVNYRVTADHVAIDVPPSWLTVAVDLTACTIQLNVGYQGESSMRWPGVPDVTAPNAVGSFTSGLITLPVSEFRFEGATSGGGHSIPARNLDQWNLYPATAQYIPGGLGGLFPLEHDFGTAKVSWSIRPRW